MAQSNQNADFPPETLQWCSDFRRPPIIICGRPITPAQVEQVRKDHQSREGRYPIPPDWWHPDGQVFSVTNSDTKYPELDELLPYFQTQAKQYPFLEYVVLCLANEEYYLSQEWDIMEELVAQTNPDDITYWVRTHFEGYSYLENPSWKAYKDKPETYPVLSFFQQYAQAPAVPHDAAKDALGTVAWWIVMENMSTFHVKNFLYQPQRLYQYLDIGLHIQNGAVTITQDKAELLRLLSRYLPENGVLPTPEEYCVEEETCTTYFCNGVVRSVPKKPAPDGGGMMRMI